MHQQFASILTEIARGIDIHWPKSPDLRLEQLFIRASLIGSGTTYRNFDQFADDAIRAPLEAMAKTVRTRLAGKILKQGTDL